MVLKLKKQPIRNNILNNTDSETNNTAKIKIQYPYKTNLIENIVPTANANNVKPNKI